MDEKPALGGEKVSAALFLMIVCGVIYAACTGRIAAVEQAVLEAGQEAARTAWRLAGGFAFFGGVIGILEKAGAVRGLVRLIRRPLRTLFGRDTGQEALEAISLNLSANMLGLGNAATPMGMRAARLLSAEGGGQPSAALCLLLVINATSVQLMPTGVIGLRSAAGSAMPAAILWPSLIASAASTGVGVLLCKLLERGGR